MGDPLFPTTPNLSHNTKPVPWVQLKDKWLRQAGFEINTPVKIRVMDKCLVLTAEG